MFQATNGPVMFASYASIWAAMKTTKPSILKQMTKLYSLETTADWEQYDGQHSFLEEVDGEDALNWVKRRNQHSLKTLGNPESNVLYPRMLSILNSKDKIPYVDKIGDFYYNFWQDEHNERGILRRTTLLSFKSSEPVWETVLDVDTLGKAEDKSWVYVGIILYRPTEENDPLLHRRVLLELSNGGADATVLREFDLVTKAFVAQSEGGFVVHEAKQRASWKDGDTLLVGTDMKTYGRDTVTDSGYPRVVYQWQRGTPLSSAKAVFEGEKTDVSVTSYLSRHRNYRVLVRQRSLTFYTSKKWMKVLGWEETEKGDEEEDEEEDEAGWEEVPIPADAQMDMFADQLLIRLRSDWIVGGGSGSGSGSDNSSKLATAGSLLAASITDVLRHGAAATFTTLFSPTDRISLGGFPTKTKNFLIISTLENVKSRLHFWKYAVERDEGRGRGGDGGGGAGAGAGGGAGGGATGGVWTYAGAEPLAIIRGASVDEVDADEGDYYWLTTSTFLSPSALFMADAALGPDGGVAQARRLKSLPPQFDSTGLVEAQYEATSKDGTKVPYFIVYSDKSDEPEPANQKWWPQCDSPAPTLLYGE